MEKISFKPTRDLEFGFDRLTIWGGKGHDPDHAAHVPAQLFQFSERDRCGESFQPTIPARASAPSTSPTGYRSCASGSRSTPILWCTTMSVQSARRAVLDIHPGIYLARFPGLEHLDLRVEGASTDTVSASVESGQFLYYETVQRQGPTNKGFLVGDWVGRQGKGGQAWLTYHLSPQEEVHFMYRNAKASNEFIPGGTTQNDFEVYACKRVLKDYRSPRLHAVRAMEGPDLSDWRTEQCRRHVPDHMVSARHEVRDSRKSL